MLIIRRVRGFIDRLKGVNFLAWMLDSYLAFQVKTCSYIFGKHNRRMINTYKQLNKRIGAFWTNNKASLPWEFLILFLFCGQLL